MGEGVAGCAGALVGVRGVFPFSPVAFDEPPCCCCRTSSKDSEVSDWLGVFFARVPGVGMATVKAASDDVPMEVLIFNWWLPW